MERSIGRVLAMCSPVGTIPCADPGRPADAEKISPGPIMYGGIVPWGRGLHRAPRRPGSDVRIGPGWLGLSATTHRPCRETATPWRGYWRPRHPGRCASHATASPRAFIGPSGHLDAPPWRRRRPAPYASRSVPAQFNRRPAVGVHLNRRPFSSLEFTSRPPSSLHHAPPRQQHLFLRRLSLRATPIDMSDPTSAAPQDGASIYTENHEEAQSPGAPKMKRRRRVDGKWEWISAYNLDLKTLDGWLFKRFKGDYGLPDYDTAPKSKKGKGRVAVTEDYYRIILPQGLTNVSSA